MVDQVEHLGAVERGEVVARERGEIRDHPVFVLRHLAQVVELRRA